MIKRFKEIEGRYIEKIIGQDRLAFAHSGAVDKVASKVPEI